MSSDKNLILENIRTRINNVFVKYRLKDKKLTRDAFIRAYNRPDDYPTIWDFIKDHGRNLNYHNELSTVNVHNSIIAKAKELNRKYAIEPPRAGLGIRYNLYRRQREILLSDIGNRCLF